MVLNLMRHGHEVVVYDKVASKCDNARAFGAQWAPNPRDTFDRADITFCCVSDPLAAERVMMRFIALDRCLFFV